MNPTEIPVAEKKKVQGILQEGILQEVPSTPQSPQVEGVEVHPGEDYRLPEPVTYNGQNIVENAGGERAIPPGEISRLEGMGVEDSGSWLVKWRERLGRLTRPRKDLTEL